MLKRLYLRLSGERTYIFDINETVHTEKGDEETWLVRVEPNDLGVCEVVMKSTDCIFEVIENETLVAQRIQPKEWNVLVHAWPSNGHWELKGSVDWQDNGDLLVDNGYGSQSYLPARMCDFDVDEENRTITVRQKD